MNLIISSATGILQNCNGNYDIALIVCQRLINGMKIRYYRNHYRKVKVYLILSKYANA